MKSISINPVRLGQVSTIGLLVFLTAESALANSVAPTQNDYSDAARVLEGNLQGLVRNKSVRPHWIGNSGRFWYRRDGESGQEFVIVTPTGHKSLAFDHAKLAEALAKAVQQKFSTTALPASLKGVHFSDDLDRLYGTFDQKEIRCDLGKLRCETMSIVEPDAGLLYSPHGQRAVFIQDDNLWIRDVATGAEQQLTVDGAPYYSWARTADNALTTIVRKNRNIVTRPYSTFWSSDGQYLISPRIDERKVAINPFVEWVPIDGSRRPILHNVRSAFMGDKEILKVKYFLFDIERGKRFEIDFPVPYDHPTNFSVQLIDWAGNNEQAFLLSRAYASKSIALFRLDLSNGKLEKVIEEFSATYINLNTIAYHKPNVRVIANGSEFVWYSERTGFGHLYLYDAQNGHLKNVISSGPWVIHDILAIDESRREIFFTGGGREPGSDPYLRQLYRSGLDGNSEAHLLTQIDADHHFESAVDPIAAGRADVHSDQSPIQTAADVFVDTWSTVNQPPISALRSTRNGEIIVELERADASRLYEAGWQPPVRERVTAADGTTDLYAVYYRPYGLNAGESVPVIDAAYGGPQETVAPRNFIAAYRAGNPLGQSALSRLGFAVVTVDGRGTPQRSRAFRDAGYINFTQVGIDDHIAAIRELAHRYPEIDLSRVGVYGWSWGGTFAAQAILSKPDFYKVAVSGAGIYDYAAMYVGWEKVIGPPIYADGSGHPVSGDEAPVNWQSIDITRMADRLTGDLLIIYGDIDENVPPVQAFRIIDALIRANKPFDLMYLPNRTHVAGMQDSYVIKRTWDYFVEHLLHSSEKIDVRVNMPPISLWGK